MRYSISGSNTSVVEPATGSVQSLLGRNLPTDRAFWLRCIWYGSSGTDGDVRLFDATAGTAATSATLLAALPAATGGIAALPAGYREFAPPGLKFESGCCIALAASGSIAIGRAGGNGYEE